jgi:GH15 family glucan-1,4-alpha-glucosidase
MKELTSDSLVHRYNPKQAADDGLGNYPQAFTHLSLITACYNIDRILNRSYGHTALDTFNESHG